MTLVILAGCYAPDSKPLAPLDIPDAARRISESARRIRNLYYPDVRPGGGVSCSIYYSKPDNFLLRARRLRDEIEIGMTPALMWFWMRSHDPSYAYAYRRDEAMLVKDMFRPDVIASVLGSDDNELEWKPSGDIARAVVKEKDHDRVVFMDSEKIVRHEIWREGRMSGSVDVIEFNKWENFFLPRTVRIRSMGEERVVNLGDVQINKGEMMPVPSRPTKKL